MGSASFGFAQNTITDFQNAFIVALSSTNATKRIISAKKTGQELTKQHKVLLVGISLKKRNKVKEEMVVQSDP